MKKVLAYLLTGALLAAALAGCAETDGPAAESSKLDAIPFQEGQLYAVAYLGYGEIEDLSYYTDRYLDSEALPIHYFSPGDYYLIIPRYADMSVALYKNDIQTDTPVLVYEAPACGPFIIQCNISDIFPDATVHLTYGGETAAYTPFISLENGAIQAGERGLNLTK